MQELVEYNRGDMNPKEIHKGKAYVIVRSGKHSARMVEEIFGSPPQVSWYEVPLKLSGDLTWKAKDVPRGVCELRSFASHAKREI